MSLVAALGRDEVAGYVSALITVYFILILIRVLLSWFPRIPYHPVLRAVVDFVHQVTDPYLNLFRRILPPVGGGGFALDLSPIVGILVLYIVGSLVVAAIQG